MHIFTCVCLFVCVCLAKMALQKAESELKTLHELHGKLSTQAIDMGEELLAKKKNLGRANDSVKALKEEIALHLKVHILCRVCCSVCCSVLQCAAQRQSMLARGEYCAVSEGTHFTFSKVCVLLKFLRKMTKNC